MKKLLIPVIAGGILLFLFLRPTARFYPLPVTNEGTYTLEVKNFRPNEQVVQRVVNINGEPQDDTNIFSGFQVDENGNYEQSIPAFVLMFFKNAYDLATGTDMRNVTIKLEGEVSEAFYTITFA